MSEGVQTTQARPADGERWLDEHGDYLYRYALSRVGRGEAAEDLVQDTLLAALQSAARFEGRSSERTWLVAILRKKLIDRLRRRRGRRPSEFAATDEWVDGLFDRTGHWKHAPGVWGGEPSATLERREFWQAFDRCRTALPERMRRVLVLRLLEDVSVEEIGEALMISAANVWTLLHRARLRLWKCLDRNGEGPVPQARKP